MTERSETPKLTGFFNVDGSLYRISRPPEGGLISEVFVKGKGFSPSGNIAEIHWEGMRVSDSEAETFMG